VYLGPQVVVQKSSINRILLLRLISAYRPSDVRSSVENGGGNDEGSGAGERREEGVRRGRG